MKEHPTHKGYFVTEDGRVFSNKKGTLKELFPGIHKQTGYRNVRVRIGGKLVSQGIHRLVAETYIPNPTNLPLINHKNENRNDNKVENLEWCDYSYNRCYSQKLIYKIKTPTNTIVEVWSLRKFCKEHNIPRTSLRKGYYNGFTLLETSQS
jgi:hypothetical protein